MNLGSKKKRLRTALWLILFGALAVGSELYRKHRLEDQERALEELAFDEFEMKAATFEDALRQVTAKVHALGHPELELVIYPDASKAPGFHASLSNDLPPSGGLIISSIPSESESPGIPGLEPTGDLHLSIKHWADSSEWKIEYPGGSGGGPNPITLKEILGHIKWHFRWACAIRGQKLVATPAAGTLERYRKEVIRINLLHEWRGLSPTELQRELQERQGVPFYEGMTVAFRQGKDDIDELEIYGPKSEIEVVDTLVSPHPPSLLQEYRGRLRDWWLQLRFRFFP